MKRLCALAVLVLAVPSLQGGDRADAGGGREAKIKIAFVSDRDGNEEIYVMNADGSGQTNLSNNSAFDFYPAFNPDGSKIAFVSGRDGNWEVYVMNADGTGVARLTNNAEFDAGPTFSPDGSKIAFDRIRKRDGISDIYVMNADGSGQARLTTNTRNDSSSAFSPDGSKIAFASNRDGNREIYVMNRDGSGQTNLTKNGGDDRNPSFSPDGSKIVFASKRDGNFEIYVMSVDGSGQTRLTNNEASDFAPGFRTDGSRIVFQSKRDGNHEIYVMDADGSGQTRLTNNAYFDADPSSPLLPGRKGDSGSAGRAILVFAPLDKVVNEFMGIIGADAASLAVSKNGRLVFASGYGWSDEDKTEPTRPDNTFRIASNTKPITAAVVKHLIRTERISSTTPVFPYLAIQPYNGRVGDRRLVLITIQHLLDHKGGWDRSESFDPMYRVNTIRKEMNLRSQPTATNIVEYMLAQPLQFAPGQKRAYSNFGYMVLGRVIEKATGQSYSDAVQSVISRPLGVSDIRLSATKPEDRDPKEVFYPKDRGLAMLHRDAAGGLTASAPSLCAFLQNYWFNGDVRMRRDRRAFSGFGSLPNSTTALMVQRSDGIDYVVMLNASTSSKDREAFRATMNRAISSLTGPFGDGSGQTNLTNIAAFADAPASNPSGIKIAFTSRRAGNDEIYLMNLNGTGQTRLTNNGAPDRLPAFSPDGSKIAFASLRDGNWDIYVVSADGTVLTRLTNNTAVEFSPAFSPDGSKIAFRSDRDGNQEIYIMNADGSGQTRLTISAGLDGYPAFSPDGSKIAFSSRRDGNSEVYVMNADGSAQTNLTNNAAVDGRPVFSPDGSKIAFTSDRDGNFEIYLMNADGSGQMRLTNSTAIDGQPAFSPDGTKIAFRSRRDGNDEIYVMNADGTNQTRLTKSPFNDWDPSFPLLQKKK